MQEQRIREPHGRSSERTSFSRYTIFGSIVKILLHESQVAMIAEMGNALLRPEVDREGLSKACRVLAFKVGVLWKSGGFKY